MPHARWWPKLSAIFSEENDDLWYVCFLTGKSTTSIATPSSYHLEQFSALTHTEKSVLMNSKEQLQRALDTLYAGDGSSAVLHNDSFWWKLISTR